MGLRASAAEFGQKPLRLPCVQPKLEPITTFIRRRNGKMTVLVALTKFIGEYWITANHPLGHSPRK